MKAPENWADLKALCLCRAAPVIMSVDGPDTFESFCELKDGEWFMRCPMQKLHPMKLTPEELRCDCSKSNPKMSLHSDWCICGKLTHDSCPISYPVA